jgi:hypothetical protein
MFIIKLYSCVVIIISVGYPMDFIYGRKSLPGATIDTARNDRNHLSGANK